jgi:hypothetical protein
LLNAANGDELFFTDAGWLGNDKPSRVAPSHERAYEKSSNGVYHVSSP